MTPIAPAPASCSIRNRDSRTSPGSTSRRYHPSRSVVAGVPGRDRIAELLARGVRAADAVVAVARAVRLARALVVAVAARRLADRVLRAVGVRLARLRALPAWIVVAGEPVLAVGGGGARVADVVLRVAERVTLLAADARVSRTRAVCIRRARVVAVA